MRGGQIGLGACEFDGIGALLPEQLFGELHRAGADAAKHFIIRGRNLGICLVDRRRTDRLIVHHRQYRLVSIDKNGPAAMA